MIGMHEKQHELVKNFKTTQHYTAKIMQENAKIGITSQLPFRNSRKKRKFSQKTQLHDMKHAGSSCLSKLWNCSSSFETEAQLRATNAGSRGPLTITFKHVTVREEIKFVPCRVPPEQERKRNLWSHRIDRKAKVSIRRLNNRSL